MGQECPTAGNVRFTACASHVITKDWSLSFTKKCPATCTSIWSMRTEGGSCFMEEGREGVRGKEGGREGRSEGGRKEGREREGGREGESK